MSTIIRQKILTSHANGTARHYQKISIAMFLRILILIIVVYYLIKWLVKMILPHVIKQQMDQFQDQFNQQNSNSQQKRQRREGSVRVEKVPQKPEPSKNDDDYVDYEEIK
jgi:cytoskeletal protein RodZ